VKPSVNVAAPDSVMVTVTADVPSSWKFPFGVWIVAVYGLRDMLAEVPAAAPGTQVSVYNGPLVLLPVIVVVPEVIVNVALKVMELSDQVPDSANIPGYGPVAVPLTLNVGVGQAREFPCELLPLSVSPVSVDTAEAVAGDTAKARATTSPRLSIRRHFRCETIFSSLSDGFAASEPCAERSRG
jgi:hypothetical protein